MPDAYALRSVYMLPMLLDLLKDALFSSPVRVAVVLFGLRLFSVAVCLVGFFFPFP